MRPRFHLATIAATVIGLAALYRFPPATASIYPPCPIHLVTGLLCPGCGATRALAVLLHGHILQAIHFNPLFVMLLPAALAYAVLATRRDAWPTIPAPVLTFLFAVTAAFTIYRNLP